MATKLRTVEDALKELPTGLDLLRQPFPTHQVSKLPKETKAQIDARKADKSLMVWKCEVCGGAHHKNANHLDYVGHAALTDRLLDADPNWSWEPVAFRDGLPAFDATGGLWIRLTVCGVSRLGYGHGAPKPNMDPGAREKEVIGDALRNAAMRFGAALDLWHKGDLHVDDDTVEPANDRVTTGETPPAKRVPLDGPYKSATALKTACHEFAKTLENMGDMGELIAWESTTDFKEFVEQVSRDAPQYWLGSDAMPAEFIPLVIRVANKRRELEELEGMRN